MKCVWFWIQLPLHNQLNQLLANTDHGMIQFGLGYTTTTVVA